MTVSTPTAVTVHTTNASVTQYSFNFKVFNASEIVVTIILSGSEQLVLTQNTHYTVSGVGDEYGGFIHMTAAGLAAAQTGRRMAINRRMPFVQGTDFATHSIMPAETVERTADIATMERQELLAMMNRAVLGDPSVTTPISYAEFVALRDSAVDAAYAAISAADRAEAIIIDVESIRDAIANSTAHLEDLTVDLDGRIAEFKASIAVYKQDINKMVVEYERRIQDSVISTEGKLALLITHFEDDTAAILRDVTARLDEELDRIGQSIAGFETTSEEVFAAAIDVRNMRDEVQAIIDSLEAAGEVVLPASQADVDAGTIDNKYVSPATLNGWSAKNDTQASIDELSDDQDSIRESIQALEEKINSLGDGIPIGFESMWPAITPPPGWLDESLNMGLIPRATYPDLWAFALASGNLLDDTTWQANFAANGSVPSFSTGDGSTTFRIPLLRKVYIRARDVDSGLNVGTYQGDAIRNITGVLSQQGNRAALVGGSGAFVAGTGRTSYAADALGGSIPSQFSFNASAVVPTASENRPVSAVRLPIIKALDIASTSNGSGTGSSSDVVALQMQVSQIAAEVRDTRSLMFASQQTLHVQDKKGSGIQGGTFTQGAWRTRTLNSIIENTIDEASLDSNRITLPAGTYLIEASAPAFNVSNHQARLFDITNSVTIITGTTEFSSDWGWTMTSSRVAGVITLTATTVLELQHFCTATYADSGFGQSIYDPSGAIMFDNIYANIIIRRFANGYSASS